MAGTGAAGADLIDAIAEGRQAVAPSTESQVASQSAPPSQAARPKTVYQSSLPDQVPRPQMASQTTPIQPPLQQSRDSEKIPKDAAEKIKAELHMSTAVSLAPIKEKVIHCSNSQRQPACAQGV